MSVLQVTIDQAEWVAPVAGQGYGGARSEWCQIIIGTPLETVVPRTRLQQHNMFDFFKF